MLSALNKQQQQLILEQLKDVPNVKVFKPKEKIASILITEIEKNDDCKIMRNTLKMNLIVLNAQKL